MALGVLGEGRDGVLTHRLVLEGAGAQALELAVALARDDVDLVAHATGRAGDLGPDAGVVPAERGDAVLGVVDEAAADHGLRGEGPHPLGVEQERVGAGRGVDGPVGHHQLSHRALLPAPWPATPYHAGPPWETLTVAAAAGRGFSSHFLSSVGCGPGVKPS